MKDIYLKRNELCDYSFRLRTLQFGTWTKHDNLGKIIKERKEIMNKWKFYDNYIKMGGKLKCKKKDMY